MVNAIAHFEIAEDSDWLSSSSRADLHDFLGIKSRIFVDAEDPHRVSTLLEMPNLESVVEALRDQAVIASMILHGIKMDTFRLLIEK